MKLMIPLCLCLVLACNAQQNTMVKSNTRTTEMKAQAATVETHVISRGRFQYLLVVPDGPHAGKYLPETTLPDQYCRDKLEVVIDATVLDEKGMVYKPGPTDIPEEDFEVHKIRVEEIRMKE